MGELYERLLDQHPSKPKISTDGFQACLRLFISGTMNLAQISQLMADHYGAPLGTDSTGSNAGQTEAGDVLAWVNADNGTTTAARLQRLERSAILEAVLVVVDLRQAPLDTPAAVRAALGNRPDRS